MGGQKEWRFRRRFRGETRWPSTGSSSLFGANRERGTRTWFLAVEKLTASNAVRCFWKPTCGSMAEINPRILARRRKGDRSASAFSFSRPAQRSLTFRPAWSLSHLKVTRYTRVLHHICHLLRRPGCFRPSDRLAGWDSHPLKIADFHGILHFRHVSSRPYVY